MRITSSRIATRVRNSGSSARTSTSFAAHLATCGYAPTTVQSQLKLLGHFNEWLMRRRWDIHQLNDALVDTFLKDRSVADVVHRGDATTVHQFLTHLRACGVLAPPARWSTSRHSGSCSATTRST